ncbi:hypothetical protein GYA93_18180 [Gordonia desulfuricans]|uniref:Uncharacterized protein n=1 Tax=Gordonia desulfuricans TaxID=89051 RepID=A0A7K3LTB4_9ACTN|nr:MULTISPECIES: hypothetical protein [Gordonia]KOY49283.1 hypothetical protein ISGA_11290 [Gordonia sp. NB41Y]NDK91490.1 hypothetical protein [Gordonia desulfuricans]WLP91490.1 hypothetical protein Q9K23_04325 [Gordonia sp. NB41Y]
MTYRDPRDPRTSKYEPGYAPDSRAYSRQDPAYQDPGYQNPAYQDPAYQNPANAYGQDPYAQQQQPPRPAAQPRKRVGPDINVGMFVGGIVMTGVVTGLAAWLVAWIIRSIVDQVNASGRFGIWNPVANDEIWFALTGFLCAVAAGALWYVLQIITPTPDAFFRWIVGLLIAAAVIIPIVAYASGQISVGIGTAVMHLVIGLPIFSLVPAMGHKSVNSGR